ncbi:uncharacterized protein LOC112030963 [Quercus suber]|uniref:uncharacterized protein LOC112030963 n=1 Tax=Quercus suber TaxID=58331 RepID=UPI000CE2020B|nr:uncharacterized protein LOC112030963 [Quercus suber]
MGGSHEKASRQSSSRRSRDKSWDFIDKDSASPKRRKPWNAAMDAMSHALRKVARSPFSEETEQAQMSSRFSRPPFISYDGKTNLVKKGSIHSFGELIQEFEIQFMTCSQVPQLVYTLLSMKMGAGETFRSYTNRYWELYNEIGGGNEKVHASTFKWGLPKDSELQESLTMRPSEDMRQLMRHIEEYKRLKDDRQQSKRKAPATSQYSKES